MNQVFTCYMLFMDVVLPVLDRIVYVINFIMIGMCTHLTHLMVCTLGLIATNAGPYNQLCCLN
jgi:hypothetical protein